MKRYLFPFLAFASLAQAQDGGLADDRTELVLENSLGVIEAQFGGFRDASVALARSGRAFCENGGDEATLRADLAATYLAWAKVDMYQFGPMEQQSALLAVNFWPDKKGFVEKHADQLEALDDTQKADPAAIRTLSVAVQGLPALIDLVEAGRCPEIIGVSANVAQYGAELYDGWFGAEGWANWMQTAGPSNSVYTTRQEAIDEIYTAIGFGVERAKTRLEQPLGTFEQPLPNRAEADALGISTDIVISQLNAVNEMIVDGFGTEIFQPNRLWVEDTIAAANKQIAEIPKPLSKAVNEPEARFQIEAALTRIDTVEHYLAEDVGPELGVSTGFSPGDGD